MSHPDYDFALEMGCEDWSDRLGIRKMPAGYRLLLDGDRMYFTWFELETGRESEIHWDRWAVWRGARDDKLRAGGRAPALSPAQARGVPFPRHGGF